ncbi:MAG: 1-acyl-sn-glycerol-3-phosphate acyltransferase [Actinomycetes bacterium]
MRRLISVPVLVLLALALTVLAPLWVPVVLLVDLCTAPRRCPRTRLLAFATWWAWLETLGLAWAGWTLVTGRARRPGPHYRLQAWWANGLVVGLRLTCRLVLEPRHTDALTPGPVIVLPRHASLADALLSAWFVTQVGYEPRYVLKQELQLDPCLDIVGHRIPNHFLDRTALDNSEELAALRTLAADAEAARSCVVIFPEGTRANPEKRARALARIAERNPDRADRLAALEHCNPPRLGGTLAVLAGAPTADVAFMWHAGFEGLDTFGGILRTIPGAAPILIDCVRVPRAEVPEGDDERAAWLDTEWLALDRRVDTLLAERATMTGRTTTDERSASA